MAAGLSLAAVLGILLAGPAPVAADYFEANNLHDCVGHTQSNLTHAPDGYLPFGGVRVFKKDDQRGGSRTYCLTIKWDLGQPNCCWAEMDIMLPDGFEGDVESLRIVVAAGCYVKAIMYPKTKAWYLRREFTNWAREPEKTRWRERGIPELYDDRIHAMHAFISCWGGER